VFEIPRNIAIVVNPIHPKALSVADTIRRLLHEKSIEHTLFTSQWPQNWIDFTEAWIIGGDGTLNYFINQYPQFDLPLALFKGGTGNDFHWLLYGTISVEQQVEIVLNATPQPVDAGLCNNRLFINGVGIGFDGKVVKDLAGKKKKKASYLLTILKNIFRYKAFLCTLAPKIFTGAKNVL
jgi:diacylglycerol kinase family enzyme